MHKGQLMKFNYTFPPLDEFKLDNGLNIICIADHEQSGLVLALQLPVGHFSDPPEREGLCELTAGLLAKGTETLTPDEFSEKLESAGATFFSEVGEENCVLGMRMRAVSGPSLLPLFVEMISRPRLAVEEFSRVQREMITALRAETVDTGFIATRHFYAELVENDLKPSTPAAAGMTRHPAGRFQTIRSLKKINLKEVKDFFNDFFSPEQALLVVAGDYDRAKFKQFVTGQLSPWKHSRIKKTVIAPPARHRRLPAVRLVNKRDLTQTSLAIGHASPGEKCPDKNALLLANHIFGGGNFSSRLMTRIRTVDGKTYGISSQLLSETDFGTFMITTSTRNKELGGVLTSIVEEYRRFCKEGVTTDELEKAKQFAIGNMAFQLEGIGNVVDKLLWLRFYGRQNAYIERFEETITSIDVSAVNNAIRTYLSPDNLIIVAVGKKAEIESQLKPFGSVKNYHFRDKL
jgi:zinc protease